jgi:hypothetical protein
MSTTDDFIALLRRRIDHGIDLLAERGVTKDEIADLILDMEGAGARAKLDLNNCNQCVLAAVYGSYSDGLALLGINEADAILFGFTLGHGAGCDPFDELTWQWRLRLGLDKEHA